jgi:hypothetical protein
MDCQRLVSTGAAVESTLAVGICTCLPLSARAAARTTSAEDRYVFFVCLQEKGPGNYLWSLFPVLVSKKEQHNMTRTKKQSALPGGMALVETADCRWFEACASLPEIPHRIDIMEGPALIPPALDIFHHPEPGHDCREEAIETCRAWCEAVELTEYWQRLAACTELYPERTAWYIDEIAQLTGGYDIPRLHCGISVHAVVLVRQTTGDNGTGAQIIAATGGTPDEAIETLYQRVYEWSRESQATASAISTRVV